MKTEILFITLWSLMALSFTSAYSNEPPRLIEETKPDLTLIKIHSGTDTISTYQTFAWELTVHNNGDTAVTFFRDQIILRDELPTNMTYENIQCANFDKIFNYGYISASIENYVLTVKATGEVRIDEGGSFLVQFVVKSQTIGEIINPRQGGSCQVDPDNIIAEINEDNNTASDTIVVNAPDLIVSKSNDVDGSITLGEFWYWTIKVQNVGNGSARFNGGIPILFDCMPDENISYENVSLENISGISPMEKYDLQITQGCLYFCPLDGVTTIAPNASCEITFKCTPTAVDTFINPRAERTCMVDPNHAIFESNEENNTTSDTVVVRPALPTLSINDISVTEGNDESPEAIFSVTLSHTSEDTITVDYQIQPGTSADPAYGADSDDFFEPVHTPLTFIPGDTSQTISILITSDIIWEFDEFFFVLLENAQNATIEDGEGICTILNDDPLPEVPAVSISDATIVEGDDGTTNAVFTYSSIPEYYLWEGYFQYSTEDGTAKAGEDYVATSDGIAFHAQVEISGMIAVPIIGDDIIEGDEIFYLNLYQPGNCSFADSQGVCTILNDDGPEINVIITDGIESYTIENDSAYNFYDEYIGDNSYCDFHIENLGNAALTINVPTIIEGPNADLFSITSQPSSEIAPGETSIITVTYSPIVTGTHTATLIIENSDYDENPYQIILDGEGTIQPIGNGGFTIGQNMKTHSTYPGLWQTAPEVGQSFIVPFAGEITSISVYADDIINTTLYVCGLPQEVYSTQKDSWVTYTLDTPISVGTNASCFFRFLEASVGYAGDYYPDGQMYENGEWRSSYDLTFMVHIEGDQEIQVFNGGALNNGDTYEYGRQYINSETDATFTIKNEGLLDLTVDIPIELDGPHADQFEIINQPPGYQSEPVAYLGPGDSTTFDVRFNPTSQGDKSATITIMSNDSDECPYEITITGTSKPTGEPEITVRNEGIIADSSTYDFGSILRYDSTSTIFTIENTGTDDLSLTIPFTLEGDNPDQFGIESPDVDLLLPGDTTNFIVYFTPEKAGNFSTNLAIGNNDKNPFIIYFTGESIYTPTQSGYAISQTSYNNSTGHNWPPYHPTVGQSFTTTYPGTITNIQVFPDPDVQECNTTTLRIAGYEKTIRICGDASDGIIDVSVPVEENTQYGFSLGPVDVYYHSYDMYEGGELYLDGIKQESKDLAFIISIRKGDIPEMRTCRNDGYHQKDGSTYGFGDISVNHDTTVVFTIINRGTANLRITTPLSFTGDNADQFSIISQPDTTIAPRDSTTFSMRFSPTSEGAKSAQLAIGNNDWDRNPYDITFNGTGINGGGGNDIEIKGIWAGQMTYALVDKDITYIITNETWTIDWVNESLGDIVGEILQYSNENNVAIAQITEHPDVPEQVGLYLKTTWTVISSDSIIISHSDLYETMQEAIDGPSVGIGTYAYSRIKEMQDITGSWQGLLLYAWADDRPVIFTINNATAFVDWVDEEAGDVSFDVIQYDSNNCLAIMQITSNPDAPHQVGMYIKITWEVNFANEIAITWYMHNETEEGALNGTEIIGTYSYTRSSVGVQQEPVVVTSFQLYQNYPNPFNPTTAIKYALPKSGIVTLRIYDVHGREISTLVHTFQEMGIYIINFNADQFASGIYYYRLSLGQEFIQTRKMLLIH